MLGNFGSWTRASHVENLRYIGSGDFRGTDNGLANRIEGGAGDDILTGGAGADTFVLTDGADRVTEFTTGEDRGAVTDVASFDALLPSLSQAGHDVVLVLGGTLTLQGATLGSLSASDFVFG